MFGFLTRTFGSLLSSVCVSVVSLLLVNLILSRKRRSGQGFLQKLLSLSYYLYAALLGWLRPYVAQFTGLDVLSPRLRSGLSSLLSLAITWGACALLHLAVPIWLGIAAVLHGLFVGRQWEKIISPDAFQLGSRLE